MKSEQFLRITRLLGEKPVARLHEKHVVVVGLGAVGGEWHWNPWSEVVSVM